MWDVVFDVLDGAYTAAQRGDSAELDGWFSRREAAGLVSRLHSRGLFAFWVECCFLTKVVLFFNIRIHVHSYACVCIHMHFIVFCMHSDALHSTIRLHSNAFCNHFELLHSSDARRLHSDAFSYLQHSRHVTF
jgi:hypothetical protein